jgi:histidine triad (HIT) family protein
MSCVFCDIVNKVINARIIAENQNAIAFLDVSPITDGHTLVITKEHYKNLSSTPNNVLNDVIALTKEVANKLYESELRP